MRSRKLSILIVDDNSSFVTRMASLLHETGNTSNIYSAHSYEEATDMLLNKPDLVLLDIRLKGENGIALLEKIKTSAADCEVIMVTNYSEEYYRQRCRKLGANLFLDKTSDFALLPGIIEAYCN